jgi:hypothetical protein
MARLGLIGGCYQARSGIANDQRCVNYYPEINQKDAPVPLTFYQRPGLRVVAQGPVAPVRQTYRASNGNGYCCIGSGIYSISPTWQLTLLGQISADRVNPVSMIDNGIDMLIVDGSAFGWTVHLATNAFAAFVDPTGLFVGGDRADVIDTFILNNIPGTNDFISTLSNELAYDPLYIAGKSDYPDPLMALIVNRHEILLIGQLKTEVWYDAGNANFPFAELPGAYFEHGTCAKYSVASSDISVFMLSQDLQGAGMVMRVRGYECKRISTHAIEQIIQSYPTISDAIGYTYQQQGHLFYVLCFPSGDATWVYDDSTDLWHQRAWTDGNGQLHRHRSNCGAWINGTNVVGDWQNGALYAQDLTVFTDNVAGVAGSISWIRGFPQILAGANAQGQEVPWDGRRMRHKRFAADIECGMAPVDATGKSASISLRWSDDRGKTWGNAVLQSLGAPGFYTTEAIWRSLGEGRYRVYELYHSVAGPAALNGAWIDSEVLTQ